MSFCHCMQASGICYHRKGLFSLHPEFFIGGVWWGGGGVPGLDAVCSLFLILKNCQKNNCEIILFVIEFICV